ncbi:DUF2634 domain-containing protein [Bacillus sp. AFS075034]|uniref:DUF2634 domain-containing protein n=1 Tax=Bacillus sp. AFS075034 TaxID=2034281 RepID=UPI000BF91E8D|nr:DUF2634 domain-containing protein [Bacillus sp. AFS075034]PFW61556.1 hypothetical protein COL20_17085 [Bacillus sp. AFS075034]
MSKNSLLPKIDLQSVFNNENFESEEVQGYLSPLFNYEKGEFFADASGAVMLDDGKQGMANLIEKIHRTPRNVYRVYTDAHGSEVRNVLIDSEINETGRISMVKEAIRDSLIYDERIVDVSDIEIQRENKDTYIAIYTVHTIYANIPVRREVKI